MIEALSKPFPLEDIEWRVQSAALGRNGYRVLVLPYITSRAVLNRLDEVCGGYWKSRFKKITIGNIEAFQCTISIKLGDEWISRTDAAEVSDIESVKGGHSNAMKRAGVQWGIGRYLYELEQYWVPLVERGNNYVGGDFKVNGKNTFIKGYFNPPKLPNWAMPSVNAANAPSTTTSNQPAPSHVQQAAQQPKETKPSAADQKNAVSKVTGLLQQLNVPANYVGPLLERASQCKKPLEQASLDELRKLYHVLHPVKEFLFTCRKYGIDDDKALYYAQIILKEKLENAFSLFFKMNATNCKETLHLIREDLNIQSQIG